MLEFFIPIIIALTAAVLLLVIMLRRPRANDDTGFAELRGQLAQMASQSGELQKVIASQMADSEGRLGTRLEQSLRDQNERIDGLAARRERARVHRRGLALLRALG